MRHRLGAWLLRDVVGLSEKESDAQASIVASCASKQRAKESGLPRSLPPVELRRLSTHPYPELSAFRAGQELDRATASLRWHCCARSSSISRAEHRPWESS